MAAVSLPVVSGDSPFTLCCRVNFPSLAGFAELLTVNLVGFTLKQDAEISGGALQVQQQDGANHLIGLNGVINTWTHAAVTWDGVSVLNGYRDGVLIGTLTANTLGRPAWTRVFMGNAIFLEQDVVIYSAALNIGEIAQLSTFRKPARQANLFAWLPMDAGANRNKDYGPNALTFAETGGPTDGAPAPVPWAASGGGSTRERGMPMLGRRIIRR